MSKFKILYASDTEMDETLFEFDWLKENLPDLLKVWINLKRDIIWKIDIPFNFSNARLARVRGKVNKNLPPIANKIAKIISPIIIKNLSVFDIFLDEILVTNLSKK